MTLDVPGTRYGVGPVRIRLAGNLSRLPVLRAVVGSHGLMSGFDPVAVADLTLAVDEACTALIARGRAAGSALTVDLTRSGHDLDVEIDTGTDVRGDLLDGFTGHVLSALTDDAHPVRGRHGGAAIVGIGFTARGERRS